ncbi:hypothetical protein HBI15_025420 [Parastagonospora nodorum]|nr:hypothetical protein HBI15_025420 [Parastagonospora nodorum]
MRLHKSSGGIYEDAEMGIGRLGSVMREWSLGYGKRFREVMERAMTWRCRGRAEKCSVDAADDWAGIRAAFKDKLGFAQKSHVQQFLLHFLGNRPLYFEDSSLPEI